MSEVHLIGHITVGLFNSVWIRFKFWISPPKFQNKSQKRKKNWQKKRRPETTTPSPGPWGTSRTLNSWQWRHHPQRSDLNILKMAFHSGNKEEWWAFKSCLETSANLTDESDEIWIIQAFFACWCPNHLRPQLICLSRSCFRRKKITYHGRNPKFYPREYLPLAGAPTYWGSWRRSPRRTLTHWPTCGPPWASTAIPLKTEN